MIYDELKKQDEEIFNLIQKEALRQKQGLEMIPSENYVSSAVLEAMGSVLTNKYSEGYPGKRYYGGNVHIDEVERLAQKRALQVFGAADYHVNVQPLSGSPANLAVYFALLHPGDTIMSLKLDHGGHLTHGSPANFSGKNYRFVYYPLDPKTETLDYDVIEKLAREHKPKIILSGYTAYPRTIDFERIAKIASHAGAISMADISHISGLIVGGAHPSPFPSTDIITTTTHKTLRGPRAAMIFCREKYKEQIDKAVFPGMQGGPHENTIAAIAVALAEAAKPEFADYARQIVKNSQALADSLVAEGLKLVSDGTDNHLMLIDLRPFTAGSGVFVDRALDEVGISVNKTTVPNDPMPPYYPSGIRLGTPALTSRGMKEPEMREVGKMIARIVKEFAPTKLPDEKEKRAAALKEFTRQMAHYGLVKEIKAQVQALAEKFPVPGID